jgi:hypothetical protein
VFIKLWDCKKPIVIFLIAYQTAFRCKIGLCHKGYVHACITGYTLIFFRALKKDKTTKPEETVSCNFETDSKFEGVYWIKIPVYPNLINIRIKTSYKYDLTQHSRMRHVHLCQISARQKQAQRDITKNTNL